MSDNGHKGADDREMTDRIRDLEARLQQMERSPRIRARARSRFDSVVPPEAMHHFRSASREQLMGMRTLVDHWIGRIDAAEPAAPATERETIEVR